MEPDEILKAISQLKDSCQKLWERCQQGRMEGGRTDEQRKELRKRMEELKKRTDTLEYERQSLRRAVDGLLQEYLRWKKNVHGLELFKEAIVKTVIKTSIMSDCKCRCHGTMRSSCDNYELSESYSYGKITAATLSNTINT